MMNEHNSGHAYLVKVQCSVCSDTTTFLREFDGRVPFGTDISPDAEYCPKCGNQTKWDLHEEAEVKRVAL